MDINKPVATFQYFAIYLEINEFKRQINYRYMLMVFLNYYTLSFVKLLRCN